MFADAALGLREAVRTLDRYRQAQDLDPERLGTLDQQIGRLHALARKHRVAPTELAARADELRTEYESIAHADERIAQLARERQAALEAWQAAARTLSERRTAAANSLGRAVSSLMDELGMAGGRFEIALEPQGALQPNRAGAEQVDFLVSANPGQPPRPLRRVASGGELSRISLAIEVAALGKDAIQSMVFDEVDAGIGGAVAEVVGVKLRARGAQRQVLCVTHLPQVAAQAHQHVAVAKQVNGNSTQTRFLALDGKARTEELARMLGGVQITAQTRAHAQDMLKRASRL
jgi:DNA repair protein RecN (Recombination protein N)